VTTPILQAEQTAALPRVNLMPPEIAEAERFRQIQLALGGAIALVVLLVGFLYWHEHSAVKAAQQSLDQAKAQQTSLQSQLASLQTVQQAGQEVAARQALLAQAMSPEVRWSYLLNDLSFAIPSNVWLTSMQVTETPPAPTTTPAAAGAAPVPIGSITFAGVGFKHDDVAAWLDALAKLKDFTSPMFTSSTESNIGGHPDVQFGSTAVLNSNALSNRYTMSAMQAGTSPAGTGTTP
jgi:Tfp pilus assembly protein PilN